MQTQIHKDSWMAAFGLNNAPASAVVTKKTSRAGTRSSDIEAKKIREEIKVRILNGIVHEKDIYESLIEGSVITPESKSLNAIKKQIYNTRKMISVDPPERGIKKRKIIELFDKGVPEKEIISSANTTRRYYLDCLVEFGRKHRKHKSTRNY